jgi:hypothetical protein
MKLKPAKGINYYCRPRFHAFCSYTFDGMTSVQKFNYAGFAYNDFADDLKQVVLVENVLILCLMFITKIQ